MSLSLYDTTVTTFIKQLRNLSAFLQKAEKWCDDNSKPHSELLEARLYPDMNPLPFQVRVCTNFARNGTLIPGKWSFVTSSPKADDEHTFEGLQARIQRTIRFLQSVNTEDVKGGEQMPISFWPSGEPGKGPNFKFETGQKFLTQFAMPNFWFHESTAYAICRMKGVPLGKIDFIAGSGPFE